MKLTLVTGNKNKLAAWRRLLSADFELESVELDLDEIQSMDLDEIVTDKVKRAYAAVSKPVMVEDVAAGLDKLNGLPGPFMKFFEKQLGRDALFQLASSQGDPATVRCAVAYYDGKNLIITHGEDKGTVVPSRGQNGFGFDFCFLPNGHSKTYAEMEPAEKDVISHRGQAVRALLKKLQS